MTNRPSHLVLPDNRLQDARQRLPSPTGITSPRVGEIPPELSPLDALAFQGRLLAKRFEETNQGGRRISRLPHLTIANEFKRAQPSYFRSASQESHSSPEDESTDSADANSKWYTVTTEEEQLVRPKSQYPLLQSEPDGNQGALPFRGGRLPKPVALSPVQDVDTSMEKDFTQARDYFAIPRTASPEPIKTTIGTVQTPTPTSAHPRMQEQGPLSPRNPGNLNIDATALRSYLTNGNRTPTSPAFKSPWASGSIRSVPAESPDTDDPALGDSSHLSRSANPQSTPHHLRGQSPASPFCPTLSRSGSASSELSSNLTSLPRPSFNFSRPLSRTERPSFESKRALDVPFRKDSGGSSSTRASIDGPSREDSGDYPITPHFVNDLAHTPVSIQSEEYFDRQDQQNGPAKSYIYTKYSLPRGRAVKRDSIRAFDFVNHQLDPTEQHPSIDVAPRTSFSSTRPPSPPTSPHGVHQLPARPSTSGGEVKPRSLSASHQHDQEPKNSDRAQPIAPKTTSSSGAIKAKMAKGKSLSELTPEDHLDLGIECHEQGSLQKSTYHLRVAARAGQPIGMLLYALACRHGWGMRPNQQEGVQWLQKAVDSVGIDVAAGASGFPSVLPGEDQSSTDAGRRARTAQFALAIYELGVSYMNGWGIKQDRSLALRCFEVAGSWGDADALAEAGFCYAEGVGCKKDSRKAARYYRQAEAKGVSMTGNNWIYKDKYMDEGEQGRGRSAKKDANPEKDKEKETTKKPRDKSRTRTIFGMKRSAA